LRLRRRSEAKDPADNLFVLIKKKAEANKLPFFLDVRKAYDVWRMGYPPS
jgi:hypothetical protein